MKDEQTSQGFSFQLSASAPPAEVAEKSPDSGPSWFAASDERLDLDLDAFAASAPPPNATSADDETRTPAPVDATSPPPPVARAEKASESPAVRRIQFPSRAASSKPEPAARSQKTVFSSSVSQAPRAHLLSNDDAPEPPVDARQAPRPELEVKRIKSPQTTLRPQAPTLAPSTSVARERLIELAQSGAALTRKSAHALGEKSTEVARLASKLGMRLLRQSQERLSRARACNAPPQAVDAAGAPVDDEEPSLEADEASSPEASAKASAPTSREKKPWLSGGAAMVAAIGCYFGASHVLTYAVPEAAKIASAERAEAQSTESTDGVAPDSASNAASTLAAVAQAPALSKAVPAMKVQASTGADDESDEAPAPAEIARANGAPKAATPTAPPGLEQLGLPEGMSWPKKGLIEVVTSGTELVYVDGVFTGRGPLRRIPIAPGSHEVVVRTEGQQREMRLDVAVGKRARVVFGG